MKSAMQKNNLFQKNRIAIYVRESRDDNEENIETIETQRDLLIDYVKKQGLGNIVKIYFDDNVSGSSFDRHGLTQLKNDVINKKIDMLLLKDLSRLGRNNAKTLLFLDFMEEYNVRVLTFDGKYDSMKDNDTVGIQTWFNEHYVKDLSKKIRANLKHKKLKGEYLGHAPFGFIKSEAEKNKLEIDQEAASIVKKIYNMYISGMGYKKIADILNKEKVPPPSFKHLISSKNKWNISTVQRILSNQAYIGHTVQGISERISFKSKKSRRLPKEQWIITLNTHPSIIDENLFLEAQKIRASRKANPEPYKDHIHLLKGILFCGDCGSKMFARRRKNRPLGYICSNYAKNGKIACSSHYINEDFIRNILINELKTLFENNALKEKVKLMLEKNKSIFNFDSEVKKLENKLNSRLKQQELLYLDKLEGKISESLFLRTNKNLEDKINSLKIEINKYNKNKHLDYSFEEEIDSIIKLISEIQLTNQIVRIMIESIYVYENKIEINFKY